MTRLKIVISSAFLCLVAACGGQAYVPQPSTQPTGVTSGPPPGTGTGGDSNGVSPEPTSGATVRYIGRFDASDANGVRFAWSGSAITTRFSGTSISATLVEEEDATYSGTAVNNYYDVYVDGAAPTSISVTHNATNYTLASGLAADTNHTLRLVKRTEAQVGAAQFRGFQTSAGGTLLPAPLPQAHSIEFIGDSITAGFGVLATETPPATCEFSPGTEDSDKSYAAVTAEALSADFTQIAFSGKGLYVNVDPVGDPNNTLPALYPYSIPQWYINYDFSAWNPQVVVINLGTNDYKNTGGVTITPSKFVAAYETFISSQVRKHFPTAQLFLVVGPVLQGADLTSQETNVKQVVSDLTSAGDSKVHYLEFPVDTGANGYGCNYHPDAVTQASMATQLTTAIKAATGW